MESSNHELMLPIVNDDNICLPLSINAVSKYWNVDLPLAEAKEISKKYPNVNGSILVEGIELAERYGLSSVILHSSLKELKKIIDLGIPPIVIVPGVYDVIQHASVISGYDEKEKAILLYIPNPDENGEFQEGAIPEGKFDDLWSEDGRLMIVIAPQDIVSQLKNDQNQDKANKLCFSSERQNILKNTDEAVSLLKEAISIDPDNSSGLTLLGSILNEKNSPDCVKFYEKAISINNRCYLAFRGLGNFYLKSKQYDKSESNYSKAIEINPTRFGPIYKNRAIVRLEQQKNAQAKDDLKNYLKFTPKAKDRGIIEQEIKKL